MITTEILIILLLLLLNAFFALSEMAIVSASKPMLRQLAKQGNKRAAAAIALAEDSGRFLSTVQVGITLVGILAGAYGGATIADKLEEPFNEIAFINPHGQIVAVILVVGIITYLSVVIGELVPKQLALSRSEKIALIVARPMTVLSLICTPIVAALENSANFLMKLLGILHDGDEKVTEAEVKAVIAEGAASGALEAEEHQMLQRIIRLGDRDVKSIMTHRVYVAFIDINDSQEIIRRKIHKESHSRYPVIDGHTTKIVGIVQAKDLLDGVLSDKALHISHYLKDAHILPENTPCFKVLEQFKRSSIHMAVLVDEYGATQGIVTAADILEAIVGTLPSNYNETNEPLIHQRKDGSWLVDGLTSIDEIHLAIGLDSIDINGKFDTIAGFFMQIIEKSPALGDHFEQYGYHFEVMDMDGRRIDKILITQVDNEEE